MTDEQKFLQNWQAAEKRAAEADPALKWQAGDALFYFKYGGLFIVPALLSTAIAVGFGALKSSKSIKRIVDKIGERLSSEHAFLREEGVTNITGMALNAAVIIVGVSLAAPLIINLL